MKLKHKVVAVVVLLIAYNSHYASNLIDWTFWPFPTSNEQEFPKSSQSFWLTTKCPYYHRPEISSHNSLQWNEKNVPKNLLPMAVDALYRHGTRYPSTELIESWNNLLERITSSTFNEAFLKAFQILKQDFPLNLNYSLHEKGYLEMQYLADELFDRVFDLFSDPRLKFDNFHFLSSLAPRCKQSANVFIGRLLRKINGRRTDTGMERFKTSGLNVTIDKTLRMFQFCLRYMNTRKVKESSKNERDSFLESKQIQSVCHHIEYSYDIVLTPYEVVDLYKLCMFKYALHDDASVCNLFDEHHLEALQYDGDMKHYFKTGYGHRINYELMCSVVIDILERFDRLIGDQSYKPNIVLRFGHAETLIPLVSFLGLFKDEIMMTLDNYEKMNSRHWRTAAIAPFSANIVFVIYNDETKRDGDNIYVSVALNGFIVELPGLGCRFCPYHEFRKHLQDKLDNLEDGRGCRAICDEA